MQQLVCRTAGLDLPGDLTSLPKDLLENNGSLCAEHGQFGHGHPSSLQPAGKPAEG